MNVFQYLREHPALRFASRVAAVAAAILAVAVVSSLAVDLGPAVRGLAEHEATEQLKRPVHIGSLRLLVARGVVEVRDFSIEGLEHTDRPFFTAKTLLVSLDWSRMLQRRPEFIITSVDLSDWQMLVEKWDNRDNFPKLTRNDRPPSGPSRIVTTLQHLRAWKGKFAYEDHESPWSVDAPNLDIQIEKLGQYEGDANFHGGLVSIQEFVPMSADFKAHFVIDGPHLHFTRIDVDSDGATSVAAGDADLSHFPEMTYSIKSHLHAQRMREIFFQNDPWPLTGDADFNGAFHLFKGGHDLSGAFTSPEFGVYAYRFPSMYGQVHWTRDALDIGNAGAKLYGGTATFAYSITPLGKPEKPLDRFEFTYKDVDVARFSDFEQFAGQRFAGAASGRNLLEWHGGKFDEERHGDGELIVTPPPGVDVMTASLDAERAFDRGHALHEWGPFAPQEMPAHLPIAAAVTYQYDPQAVHTQDGRFASEQTFVTFDGSTAWGKQARMPFRVTSRDWQESDQLLAGLLTDFGARKTPVVVGGRGEFEGILTGPFSRPRVEGQVAGEDVRAWDTLWGDGSAHIVVEDGYVDVMDGVVARGGSEIRTEGRFALGYPRDDHGEEINARFRTSRRDVQSLSHAFELDDYPITGELTGEFHLTGLYQHVFGFGAMTLEDGVAYGENFDTAQASLRFDGNGVHLDDATMKKATGNLTGSAYVAWDDTYSFNAEARGVPMDHVALFAYPQATPGGTLDFTASGSGTFDVPRYDGRFRVSDLSVNDEPVGQMTGTFTVRGKELRGDFDAASPRLAVTGTGRISISPRADSEVTIRFHDVLLDPYVRLFVPKLPATNTAVASGSLRVVGELSDLDRLLVDGTVDSLDMKLFDYSIRNAAPMRVALDHRVVRVSDLQLVGDDTSLRVGGTVSLRDQRIDLQASGDANLGILQGFFKDVRGSGRAELVAALNGPLDQPVYSGSARITNGRIRHFALPNSLDAINGTIQFDSRGIRLDDLSATMADGRVQFGGRIGLEGYMPGDLNVTIVGDGMHLRVPEGMRSTVDANLAIRGNVKAPTLSGTVLVRSAVFNRPIDPTGNLFSFASRSSATVADIAEVAPSFPLRFDLELLVPSSLRIENNLMRVTASADLQLRGTYDRPQVFGHAEVDRGEVLFEGRRYLVTKGAIDFTNPSRIEPFFDVSAETHVRSPGLAETYRVTISLTGTLDRVQANFDADPPLPAAEVVALLFGNVANTAQSQKPGQLGVGDETYALTNPNGRQTDVLETRATQLLASPISSSVGHAVEQTFGVDTFQLSPSLFDNSSDATTSTRVNPAARVTIGKRISDRVYLTFSRSLASAAADQIILLEYDASDRFSWILSRNEDNTYALEFSVRHTY
ncbi:MAG TPA: translocation/assembly module TamB domain-containing protein [Vicinamibacterales bacterium]|nr:translocation/assembly module TamB domain-containing protein [Vicinamibacterales bacterium]